VPLRLPGRPQAGLHLHPNKINFLPFTNLRAAPGPDRLQVQVPAVPFRDLAAPEAGEGSMEMRARS